MAVNYKVYRSNRSGATNGKFYARTAYRDTVTIKDLAKKMQANCTVKHSDIVAVLTELSEVMKDELQSGNRVKIDGLGTFKVGLSSKGAESANEFTAANIKNSHIIFTPEITVDASGKRTKNLLAGLRVKEADAYESLKTKEPADDKTDNDKADNDKTDKDKADNDKTDKDKTDNEMGE